MKTQTSLKQFEGLRDAILNGNKDATYIPVDKKALINLLMDHSEFHTIVGKYFSTDAALIEGGEAEASEAVLALENYDGS